MAVKKSLPDATLKVIADQISNMLPGLCQQESIPPKLVELRESFAIWTLNLATVMESSPVLKPLPAHKTRFWHHQILFDGEAKAYAESEVSDSQLVSVRETSISPLPGKIEQAIEWVESYDKESTELRLLVLTSFLIYAFWLVERHQIYIIDAFPEFADFRDRRLFSEKEFLSSLQTGIKSIEAKREGHKTRG